MRLEEARERRPRQQRHIAQQMSSVARREPLQRSATHDGTLVERAVDDADGVEDPMRPRTRSGDRVLDRETCGHASGEDVVRARRLDDEHVVVEVHEAFGQARDAVEVHFDRHRVEGRSLTRREEGVLIDDHDVVGGRVEPRRCLPRGDEVDTAHPGTVLIDTAEQVAKHLPVVRRADILLRCGTRRLPTTLPLLVGDVDPEHDDVDRVCHGRSLSAHGHVLAISARACHARRRRSSSTRLQDGGQGVGRPSCRA